MNLNNIKLFVDENNIANLSLQSNNILINEEFINDFIEAINSICNNKKIKGVIISSDQNEYNYDYDLNFLLSLTSAKAIFDVITKFSKTLRKLETIGKPIVSIIEGKIKLGGLEIILHSHYKIALDDSKTNFYFKNIKYSLIPSIGGSQRLPRLVGINESVNLFLSNKILSAEEALKINLIDEIVKEKEQLINAAKNYIVNNPVSLQKWDNKKFQNSKLNPFSSQNLGYFISKIASLHANTSDHYPSVKVLISSIYEGLNSDINSGLKIEARHFTWLIQNIETRSMIETTILHKSTEKIQEDIIQKFKSSFEENYAAEGVRLLLNGVSAPLIENAGKRLDFNAGPLEIADSNEIQCVINQLDSSDAAVASLIRSMQKINRNGLSNDKGFYDYKKGIKYNIWPDLINLIPPSKIQPSIEEVETRLLYSSINNIFYNFIKHSTIKDPKMCDLMLIKKIGFPFWTGGAFNWVKKYGIDFFNKKSNEYSKVFGSRFVVNPDILKILKSF